MDYSTDQSITDYPAQSDTLYETTDGMTPIDSYQEIDPATAMAAGMFGLTTMLFMLTAMIVMILAYWKIFTKAGKPGWAAIIPIYNIYMLIKVVKRPGWWLLLLFIPIVNFVISIIIALDLAKVFGRSSAFGIFLNWLLQPVGPLIIAFGSSKYQK